MTSEKELISKTFYLTLVDGITNEHPIKVLGDLYMDEEQKETPDLSNIRYAQGELYYLNKDYEAAIFKWERVENELKPWAIKNIADAHGELNLLALAEDYYKSVHTESLVLKTEIYLQLFSLYLRLDNEASAIHSIKKAVQINPDYSDVTEIARTFFEDRGYWDNAVELAVKEAVRTISPTWFKVLEGYVKQGHTQNLEPGYFSEVLVTLHHTDPYRFESLAAALWQSYKTTDLYFSWLKGFNNLLANMDDPEAPCKELSALYKNTYFELTSGRYLVNDFSYLIPNLLNNWLKVSLGSDVIIAAAAVLAWSELFPDALETSTVSMAEARLSEAPPYRNTLEDVCELFESIRKWAKGEGMALEERLEWIVGQLLDSNHYHVLIAGASSGGKNDIMNALLNQERFDHQADIDLANESEASAAGYEIDKPASEFNGFQTARQVMIPYRMPIAKLNAGGLDQMDLPIITDQRNYGSDVFEYLHFADSLLFILNADLSLSDAGFEMAVKMKEHMPNLPIHFVLYGAKGAVNKEEALEVVEKTVKKIDEYFPDAKVTAFSPRADFSNRQNELSTFARSIMEGYKIEQERPSKMLHFIKMTIKSLLEKRVEMEKTILDRMEWNEELASKLTGALNQLSDIKEQKVQVIQDSLGKILGELRRDLRNTIPEILRGCSELVQDNSDIGKIHVEINDEMNRRVARFIEDTALPNFRGAVQMWIQDCEAEFEDTQNYFDELSDSFNAFYGEERIVLNGDFKVLEDWRRDVDRMTRGSIRLEKTNILMRSTPSQLLLKGAGKLFGAVSKNNEMLHNKYKQFIESKDYTPIAESISDQVMQQFEIFERSLERDIKMFFANPIEVLNKSLEEAQLHAAESRVDLDNIRKNPEIYRDPLAMFELRLHQFGWMSLAGESKSIEYF